MLLFRYVFILYFFAFRFLFCQPPPHIHRSIHNRWAGVRTVHQCICVLHDKSSSHRASVCWLAVRMLYFYYTKWPSRLTVQPIESSARRLAMSWFFFTIHNFRSRHSLVRSFRSSNNKRYQMIAHFSNFHWFMIEPNYNQRLRKIRILPIRNTHVCACARLPIRTHRRKRLTFEPKHTNALLASMKMNIRLRLHGNWLHSVVWRLFSLSPENANEKRQRRRRRQQHCLNLRESRNAWKGKSFFSVDQKKGRKKLCEIDMSRNVINGGECAWVAYPVRLHGQQN